MTIEEYNVLTLQILNLMYSWCIIHALLRYTCWAAIYMYKPKTVRKLNQWT